MEDKLEDFWNGTCMWCDLTGPKSIILQALYQFLMSWVFRVGSMTGSANQSSWQVNLSTIKHNSAKIVFESGTVHLLWSHEGLQVLPKHRSPCKRMHMLVAEHTDLLWSTHISKTIFSLCLSWNKRSSLYWNQYHLSKFDIQLRNVDSSTLTLLRKAQCNTIWKQHAILDVQHKDGGQNLIIFPQPQAHGLPTMPILWWANMSPDDDAPTTTSWSQCHICQFEATFRDFLNGREN